MARYTVKCDDCHHVIRETDSLRESAEGGICWKCATGYANAYQTLCDRARRVGVPTSLDDPASPRTVQGLRDAIAAAR
jgi:hypothetical protein